MKNKLGVALGVGFLLLNAALLLRMNLETPPTDTGNGELSRAQQPGFSSSAIPSNQEAKTESVSRLGRLNEQKEQASEVLDQTFMTEAIQSQMADIAKAFESNMRFPNYSKPLNESDWNLLNPRPFVPKPAPVKEQEGMLAVIKLDQYIAHEDEVLPVLVEVSGLKANSAKVQGGSLYLSHRNHRSEAIALELGSLGEVAGVQQLIATVPTKVLVRHRQVMPVNEKETFLSAVLSLSDETQAIVTAAFKLVGTDAWLTSVSPSYVDGVHLVIPVNFDVRVPGLYRLQANLFDANSGAPISHINSEFSLEKDSNVGELKVHAVTLRAKGHSGPYLLRDFNITRAPMTPSAQTGYAQSRQLVFPIGGHDLQIYDDEDYVDPDAQRRLEFLQRMAGIE